MLERRPFGKVGAKHSLQLSLRTHLAQIHDKVIPENQCENIKSEFVRAFVSLFTVTAVEYLQTLPHDTRTLVRWLLQIRK